MKAAVVSSFDRSPRYGDRDDPVPGPGEVVVDVVAAGLHPRVRSQADGSHYTSTGDLPLVPGIDGVGRMPDGSLAFFVLTDTTRGSLAERVAVDPHRCVALAADADVARIAAGMNPGMSSWVALRRRVELAPGQSVLVLGATGNAGRLAVRIARHLGAGRVVGAGRDAERLARLPADATVSLAGDDVAARLAEVAADVDVVIDYLWGAPAAAAMTALVTGRADRAAPLRWVQVGAVAGPTLALPSALLRAANLQVLGSGQGSVRTADIVAELPSLAAAITDGALDVHARVLPLADVETAWREPGDPAARVVLVP